MTTFTRARIVEKIYRHDDLHFTRNRCAGLIETLIEIMTATLESGEDILISGFGKFCVRDKTERKGRNPVTGDPLMLPARKVVTFRCSKNLRQKLNS